MIFYIVVSALFLGANASMSQFIQDVVDTVEDVAMVCASKEKVTDADYRVDLLEDLVEHDFPPSMHFPRCAVACIFEYYKLLKEDETFNKQTVINALRELKSEDEELYRKVMKIVNNCEHETQIYDDRCENAYSMAICVKTAAQVAGLTLESLLER